MIDSLSEIRLLAQSSLRYRRQVLALKHYFARHQSTVLMLDDLTTNFRASGARKGARGLAVADRAFDNIEPCDISVHFSILGQIAERVS